MDLSHKFRIRILKAFLLNLTVLVCYKFILDPMTISFIDIGQGDAILLENQNSWLMVDTGGSYLGENQYKYKLKPYLTKYTRRSFPVIISHDDLDHCGNLEYMIEDGFVSEVITSDYYKTSYQKGLRVGDEITFNNASIHVLYDGKEAPTSNDRSLIFKLNHYGKSVLFVGDTENYGEMRVLNKDIRSDFLKIGHHGSKSSTSLEFLKTVRPKYGIISVAKDNSFGHPDKEVLARLEANGVEVFRTDIHGRVKITITRFGYFITRYLPEKITLMDFAIIFLGLLLASILYYNFYRIIYISKRASRFLPAG